MTSTRKSECTNECRAISDHQSVNNALFRGGEKDEPSCTNVLG